MLDTTLLTAYKEPAVSYPAPSPAAAIELNIAFDQHARTTGTLTPITTTTRRVLSPHARTVAIVTSPADHAGLWTIAHGTLGAPPAYATAADPHNSDDVLKQWDTLGRAWKIWADTALDDGHLPQIITANRTCTNRLSTAAERIATHPKASDYAKNAANLILSAHHHTFTPANQALLPVIDMLREHYTTGADTRIATHLGHWVEFPLHTDRHDRDQSGFDPDFEAETTTFGKAADKLNAATGTRRKTASARIPSLLKPLVTSRYEDIQRAVQLYQNHPGTPLSYAQTAYENQVRAMARLHAKNTRPSARNISARVATLGERENAGAMWQRTLWAEDAIERARGVISGDVLTGTAAGVVLTTVTGRAVRARSGDEYRTPTGVKTTVVSLEATGDGATSIEFANPLGEGDVTLTPDVGYSPPPRWVSPNWAHGAGEPEPRQVPDMPTASLTEWAETLKG